MKTHLLTLFALWLISPKVYSQILDINEPIVLLIPRDVLDDYNLFVKDYNNIEIKDFSGENSRRDVVEVILLIQALRLGGIKNQIQFAIIDSYKRIIAELSRGSAALGATSFWDVDIRTHIDYIDSTLAIIKNGDFEAGFYTSPQNKLALNAQNLNDIKKLHFVSSENWTSDWQTLQALNPTELFNTSSWQSMAKLVTLKRADVLLAPFSNHPELELEVDSLKFTPIPNFKIGLKGSRHYGISKKHPQYLAIKKALQKGLLILTQKGSIKKAFYQCGFYNDQTDNWQKFTF